MTAFKFEGGRALDAALRELSTTTARAVATRALKKAADPIAARARVLAPKDEQDLERSIKVGTRPVRQFRRGATRGDYVSVFVGIDESIDARLHIYAPAQEFGLAHTPAQPFMLPAWDSEKMNAVDRIAPELWAEISKAAARAARKAARGR